MSQEFTRIETGTLTKALATEIMAFEIALTESARASAVESGLPPTLFLGINRNADYPIGYRHAWGNAWVSTTKDGANPHAVASLRFRIEMPEPTQTNISDKTCANSASCDGDCKYVGAVGGDFQSNWTAWASDPNCGDWSVNFRW